MTADLVESSPGDAPVRRVGIRELQQHAARVIKELSEAGEIAEITSRGQVIARLTPTSPAERAFAEMIDRGEIIPAKNPQGLTDWKPLPPRPDGKSLSDVLIAMREEERW
jgi:antitoxin (DNA-binding transcriptional repressor) of toxin-antitoxin stability system